MRKKIRKAVFPVGGLGTRFLPATKSMPKEMLPVVDKPLIQYAFEEALAAGIEQFIFITGRNKNAITNHFDHAFELQQTLSSKQKKEYLSAVKDWLPKAGQIAFVRQQEPLGLGHAVYCAKNFIGDEPFAVLLADEIFLSKNHMPLPEMVKAHNELNANIIGLQEVEKSDTHKYGIVSIDKKLTENSFKIKSMVEKPLAKDAPSNLAIIGRYILNPSIFSELERSKPGAGGEIQLTDAMSKLAASEYFFGIRHDCKRFDCGDKYGYIQANIEFALERKDLKDDVTKLIKRLAARL